jgi:hypothetical protein
LSCRSRLAEGPTSNPQARRVAGERPRASRYYREQAGCWNDHQDQRGGDERARRIRAADGTFAHAVNQGLNTKLPYDTFRAFDPVALVARSFNIVVVNPRPRSRASAI